MARDGDSWVVASGGHRHWVTEDADGLRCTCLWWAKYGGGRGACKHALAVQLVRG